MLIACLGWMARIEIVNSCPKEMNASIARTHQFNGFLGSSVVNLWHISAAHLRVFRHMVYIDPCECIREHPSHGHCHRPETVVSKRVRLSRAKGDRQTHLLMRLA